jgi:hypothetical protein
VTGLNGDFDANENELVFDLPGLGVAITHLGVFDTVEQLAFYGCLLATRMSSTPARALLFKPYALKLKRMRIPQTAGPRPRLGGGALPLAS